MLSSRLLLTALLSAGIGGVPAAAQVPVTEHTVRLGPEAAPAPATIAEMAWLAGRWEAEALGGQAEEIWSPPRDGVMMGMFRLLKEGKPQFYELMTLLEEGGSLVLRLKHFDPDLTSWEEKDETVDFRYVGKADGAIHFEGLSFRPQGGDRVTVHVAMRLKDGTHREGVFPYRRANEPATPADGQGGAMGNWWDIDDGRTYRVVINHEEQYSVWYADRELPAGWKDAGFKGSKRECLDHIEEVWTDMRPLSLRRKMEAIEKGQGGTRK